ncbi:MAG: heme-binding domain-containing protein [Deltaproteobacteria bacterium]|nr:heme-binding domain-containing protein [Deltaproteobacteria bacterium]
MKNIKRYVFLGVALLFAGLWVAGLTLNPGNPRERHTGTILSAEGDLLLRRACFDCHSNETEYPWFSRLPLSSLLIAKHVKKGRRELNFSHWDRKNEKKRARALRGVARLIRKGKMPPKDYALINPKANLTEEEQALLVHEAERLGGPPPNGDPDSMKKADDTGTDD